MHLWLQSGSQNIGNYAPVLFVKPEFLHKQIPLLLCSFYRHQFRSEGFHWEPKKAGSIAIYIWLFQPEHSWNLVGAILLLTYKEF